MLPTDLVRTRRVEGISAVLLPYRDRAPDWDAFEAHVARTVEAGLKPAVNMDTGFVHLLTEKDRARVLRRTAASLGDGAFVAGAFVPDEPGAAFDPGAHSRAVEEVAHAGGIPVVFPSYGLSALPGPLIVEAHVGIADSCNGFIAFELSSAFTPSGCLWNLDSYAAIMQIDACIGAKHSSLQREPEWARLRVRDELRPGFRVYTGNDLAIDMVIYGSDYLLGLSTFAPDLFAHRDALWADGDDRFYDLNDALQAIGAFAFRPPVPAYRHSMAQLMVLRGWLEDDEIAPGALRRPDSDRAVLQSLLDRVYELTA